MIRATALLLTCAVMALTAAACGSSTSGGEGGDPASLVPANAPVYAQATIQPEGEQRDDALAAIGKVMRTGDPAGKLQELVNEQLAEESGGLTLTWEKDFAPWLGEQAGIWASDFAADTPNFAAIIQTTASAFRFTFVVDPLAFIS